MKSPSFNMELNQLTNSRLETRENRANSAGSPPRLGYNVDPRRYGTPQASYGERREPVRVPPSNAAPPRPRSQPGVYNTSQVDPRIPPSHNESLFGRRDPVRSDSINREPAYQRNEYEERPTSYGYTERARQEREAAIHREREQRELQERDREMREREARDREAKDREREMREQQEQRDRERERDQRLERAEQERSALYQDYLASQQRNFRGPGNRNPMDWLRHGKQAMSHLA